MKKITKKKDTKKRIMAFNKNNKLLLLKGKIQLILFHMINKISTKIKYKFNAKNISHDAGALSIYSYAEQIGLKETIKTSFDKNGGDSKAGPKIQHTRGDVINEMIMGYMKGYANPTEISRTVNDPVIETLTNRKIPSQSTFSRIMTSFNREDEKKLKAFNKKMIQKYLEICVRKNNGEKLEVVHLSDDSTKIQTYGNQEGGEYISHYGVVGYHPDLVTEDRMKLIMTGILRKGQVYSSNGSELLIKEVIDFIKPYTKKIIFRADSAYGKPDILKILNDYDDIEIEYFIKAKTYRSWLRKSDLQITYNGKEYHPLELPKEYFEETNDKGDKKLKPKYFEFMHKVKTWDTEEKIITKVTYRETEQTTLLEEINKDIEMLIVNSDLEKGEDNFKEYGKRGKQEQIIEEFKNDSFGGNLSCKEKVQNSSVFHLKIIAHNLMQILRLETLHGTKYANCRTATLRQILVKIGGKIVSHSRQLWIKLSSSFPYQKWYQIVMERIPIIEFRLC